MLASRNVSGGHNLVILIGLSVFSFATLFVVLALLTLPGLTLIEALCALVELGLTHILTPTFVALCSRVVRSPLTRLLTYLHNCVTLSIKKRRLDSSSVTGRHGVLSCQCIFLCISCDGIIK